jgi:hypothetical protein
MVRQITSIPVITTVEEHDTELEAAIHNFEEATPQVEEYINKHAEEISKEEIIKLE